MRIIVLLTLLVALVISAEPRRELPLPQWEFAAEVQPGQIPAEGAWSAVQIPHIFRQSGLADNHAGWYRQDLTLTAADLAGRVLLMLDGAATVAEVSVNGTAIGRHVSAYTAAAFDLTPALVPGSANHLVVRVSNRDDEIRDTLARSTLYYVNGGLFRGARLICTGALHIHPEEGSSGVFLTTTVLDQAQASLSLRTVLRNDSPTAAEAVLRQEIIDPDGRSCATVESPVRIATGETRAVSAKVAIPNPQPWNLKKSRLYTVTSTVVAGGKPQDQVVERTGLRTVEWKDGKILLNGRAVQLRGVNKHAQDEYRWNAMPQEELEADWRWLIDMGVNFVRLAHYPHDRIEYNLADGHGIAVWAENGFAGQAWAKKDEDSRLPNAIGDQLTRELVLQNWNHPSILFWSAGNEAVATTAAHYADIIRQLDTSRIISYAVAQRSVPSGLDVPAYNTYAGWYGGTYRGFDDLQENAVVSETGAGSWITQHQPWDRLEWKVNQFESEEYAAIFAAYRLQVVCRQDVERRPMFTWWAFREFYDHKFKNNRNTKGLVTLAGMPKDLYYLFQAFLQPERPVVRLAGRHHVIRSAEGARVVAFSNRPSLELWVDGIPQGRQRNGDYRLPAPVVKDAPKAAAPVDNCFGWSVTFAPGRHQLEVRDEAGNRDGFVIYVPEGGVVPLDPLGVVAELTSTNPRNPASFIDRPIEAQGPVFGPCDGSADNTWDILPAELAGASWIATGRTGDPTLATGLRLKLRQAATLRVVLSKGTFPVITLKQPDDETVRRAATLTAALTAAGFRSEAPLVWRDHHLERCDAAVLVRKVPAGMAVEIPELTVDAVVLVTPDPPRGP